MSGMMGSLLFERVRVVQAQSLWTSFCKEHIPGVVLLGPEGCTSSKLPARPDFAQVCLRVCMSRRIRTVCPDIRTFSYKPILGQRKVGVNGSLMFFTRNKRAKIDIYHDSIIMTVFVQYIYVYILIDTDTCTMGVALEHSTGEWEWF